MADGGRRTADGGPAPGGRTPQHSPVSWLTDSPTGCRLSVLVQPRASANQIVGVQGDYLRIRLAAPPVDGAANEALVRFLAHELGVKRAAVSIVSGEKGRRKVVAVEGIGAVEVERVVRG